MNSPGIEAGQDVALRDRAAANPALAPDVNARLAAGASEARAQRTNPRKPGRDNRPAFILHAEKWR